VGINFTNPWYLFLFMLIPYFAFLWLRSPKAFRPWQQKLFLGLRVLLAALLMLSLAGLELTFRHRERTVVYVADLSSSMSEKAGEAAKWINRSLAGLSPEVAAGVVSLGEKAMVEYPVIQRPDFGGFQAVVGQNHTDLAAGLRLAQAMLPEDKGRQIVLITDGKQTTGDAVEQAALLSGQGIRLDVLPVKTGGGPEALVKSVDMPAHLREGEYFDLVVNIESTVSTRGIVRITADNRLLREEAVKISKGDNSLVWSVRVEKPGLHTYKAELIPEQDTRSENNIGAAVTEVAGIPRILLVEGQPGDGRFLGQAIGSTGMQVETMNTAMMPRSLSGMAGYSSIVLINVPAMELPDSTMRDLEIYVRDLGRGLIMVGGEDSFGLGGYFKTPVEKALPVHMDIRGKGEVPSVGLAVVIDKSGSMDGDNYGIPKMELAKEAAVRALEILEDKDWLGVVAFDSNYKWVIETGPLKDKEAARDNIGSIRAGGGTNIFPALQAAYQSLVDAEVKVKHIILLTDGQSAYGGNYEELLSQMNGDKVTLSTIAVGSDSDTRLLSALAEGGKGRYYYTDDFESIPKIFTKETIIATRSYLVQEPFIPTVTAGTGLFPAGEGLPPLFGYVAASAKGTAETILVSHKGDPVLARWHYGLGRAAAWTSDAQGRWAGEWVKWSGFPQFWGKLASWTLPAEAEGDMVVTTGYRNGEGLVSVDIPGERRQVHDMLARVAAPDGSSFEISLPAEAPGQYSGKFPLKDPGAYLVQVVERAGRGYARQKTAGLVLPYSPEYLLQPEQQEFLARLAAAGGGQILDPEEDVSRVGRLPLPAVWGRTALWPRLLALAALLVPVDIAARRFNWHFRWAVRLWRRLADRLARNRAKVEAGQGDLVKVMQQQKLERERLYRPDDKRGDPQTGQTKTGHEAGTFVNPATPKQVKQPTTAKSSDDKQTAGERQEDEGFTSRLLAAKKRRDELDEK